MSPRIMHQFWSLVDTTRGTIPAALDDVSLVQWLLRQVRSRQVLNTSETDALSTYIASRLPLIRDLIQESPTVTCQFYS